MRVSVWPEVTGVMGAAAFGAVMLQGWPDLGAKGWEALAAIGAMGALAAAAWQTSLNSRQSSRAAAQAVKDREQAANLVAAGLAVRASALLSEVNSFLSNLERFDANAIVAAEVHRAIEHLSDRLFVLPVEVLMVLGQVDPEAARHLTRGIAQAEIYLSYLRRLAAVLGTRENLDRRVREASAAMERGQDAADTLAVFCGAYSPVVVTTNATLA